MNPTTSPFRRRTVAALALGLAAAGLLGACGNDDDDATDVVDDASGEIEVTGAWARTSPAMATAGAAYFEITNGTDTDDALVSASVDPSVAATVELHETSMAGGDMDGDAGMDGDEGMDGGDADMGGGEGMDGDEGMDGGDAPMMQMRPVDEIPVPAGATVALEPGGLHVMMLDLAEPLEIGSTIELTLTFEQAGEVVVTAEVRDSAP
jgi:periplasmic copper chaperone A